MSETFGGTLPISLPTWLGAAQPPNVFDALLNYLDYTKKQ